MRQSVGSNQEMLENNQMCESNEQNSGSPPLPRPRKLPANEIRTSIELERWLDQELSNLESRWSSFCSPQSLLDALPVNHRWK